MPATRDEIIADWHKRLAAASDSSDESTSRAAWLVRLRQRLYHFLLSLYGDGRWNAPTPIETPTVADGDASVVFDSPDALPLTGKPAKSDGKIRSVLNTVASANSERQAQGSLAGLTNRKLVVIVTARSGLNLLLCSQLLISEGIIARWGSWNGFNAIYVPDVQALKARSTIQVHVPRLRLPPPPPIPKPSPSRPCAPLPLLVWIALGIAVTPILAVAAAMITVLSYPDAGPKDQWPGAILYGLAVFLALISIVYVRPIGWLIQRIDRLACAAIKSKAAPMLLFLFIILPAECALVFLFVALIITSQPLGRAAIMLEMTGCVGIVCAIVILVLRWFRDT